MPNEVILLIEIQKKLEYYCTYQERCHQEVSKKINELGVYGTQMNTIISHLIEQNYLNETRFAEQFIHGKFNIKKWGKRRMIRELKQRHISDWNIKNAMKEISDKDYWKCGQVLAEKVWNTHQYRPLAVKKKKVWNAMHYRGWETDLIMENILRLEHQKE